MNLGNRVLPTDSKKKEWVIQKETYVMIMEGELPVTRCICCLDNMKEEKLRPEVLFTLSRTLNVAASVCVQIYHHR